MVKKTLVIARHDCVEQVRGILAQVSVRVESASKKQEIKRKAKEAGAVIFDSDLFSASPQRVPEIARMLRQGKKDFLILSSNKKANAIYAARDLGASDYIIKPFHFREFIARFNAFALHRKRITCIGGGTGLFNLLLGLKMLPNALLTSVVSMSDDGGSSGRLRASFGSLPPGDVRRSLVALSNAPEFMNRVMQYRFIKGEGLKGHNLGNLFLTALSEISGSMSEAIKGVGDILNIQGIVLPVTDVRTILCALFEDGSVIKGESAIDLGEARDRNLHIEKLWQAPSVSANMDAVCAMINSDFVTIGPGDLFTSVITNLLVKNISAAIKETKAKKIYLCNLMTKPGETAGYNAADHIREIIKYLGGDFLDYVIISKTKLSTKAVRQYARKHQAPVEPGNITQIKNLTRAKVILADVGDETNLVRHDSLKLKNEIQSLLKA